MALQADKALLYGLTDINDPTSLVPVKVKADGTVLTDLAIDETSLATSAKQDLIVTNTAPGTKIDLASALPAGGVGPLGWLSRIWYQLTQSLSAVLGAGEAHIGEVGGKSTVVSATLTRPNDTNAYTANDAVTDSTSVPTAIDFAGMVRSAGKSALLTTWQMTRNSTTDAAFRLWLYQDTLTPQNDNAAFSIAASATDKRVGYVDFDTSVLGSDCRDYYGVPVFTNWPVKPVSGTGLKGVLQTKTTHTPTANETYKFKTGVLQD